MDTDPEARQDLARQAKRALRRRLRALRQALPASSVAARSERIVERLTELSAVQNAERVGLYWPIEGRGEVDVRALDAWLRSRRKAVFYPYMDPVEGGFRTGFRRVDEPSGLAERGQRFLEPPPDALEASPATLDLVVVPALAAAPTGHRLGQGSGFYDATLPEHCPPGTAVIVVYHFQLLAELPLESHDVAAPIVVTDETTFQADEPQRP